MKNPKIFWILAISVCLHFCQTEISYSQNDAKTLGFVNIMYLRLRAEPDNQWSTVISQLRFGDMVYILNELFLDKVHWIRVSRQEDAKITGWVKSSLVGRFNKAETLPQAVDNISKEIEIQLQQKPDLKEWLSLPLKKDIPTLTPEASKWLIAAAIAKQEFHLAIFFTCLAYKQQSTKNKKQSLLSLATLLHPTEVFQSLPFSESNCANFIKTPIKTSHQLQETILIYHEWMYAF